MGPPSEPVAAQARLILSRVSSASRERSRLSEPVGTVLAMPTSSSDRELSLLRIAAQRLVGSDFTEPLEVVKWLGCVQAQDLPASLTAIGTRLAPEHRSGAIAATITAANSGQIVRSWPCRGTLHWVAARDIRWMQDLTRPRLTKALHTRSEALGITDLTLERAAAAMIASIRANGPHTRAQLRTALADAGVDTEGQNTYHLIMRTCYAGLLVQGPFVDGATEQRFVVADDWLADERTPGREEALALWAHAYFRSHGPAPVQDFARWAGITVGDAKLGVAALGAGLTSLSVDDKDYWCDPGLAERLEQFRSSATGTLLIPAFDELLLGYAQRDCLISRNDENEYVVPGKNGIFRPFVVENGRAIATWRASGKPTEPKTLEATAFGKDLSAAATKRIAAAYRDLPTTR